MPTEDMIADILTKSLRDDHCVGLKELMINLSKSPLRCEGVCWNIESLTHGRLRTYVVVDQYVPHKSGTAYALGEIGGFE
jgi:hypothetical protein